MKTLLTLTILLFSISVHSQIPNAVHPIALDSNGIYGSGEITIRNSFDTVPVIMLVCDTAVSGKLEGLWDNYVVYYTSYYAYSWWQKGFEIRESYQYIGLPDGMQATSAIAIFKTGYKHIKYLDKLKYELRKSILVWDAKYLTK